MDPVGPENKKNWTLKIILIIIGLALIIFGIIKIFGGLKSSGNSAPVNKFNEIYSLSADIGSSMKTAGNLLLGLAAKENAKDYAGAAKDIETSLSELSSTTSTINSLNNKISEFKAMIGAASDASVKQSGLKLVDLLEQRSVVFLNLISHTKQLIEPAKTYYEALAAGETGTYLENNQITDLSQKINEDNKTLTALAPQINTAVSDFAKAAKFQLKTSQ